MLQDIPGISLQTINDCLLAQEFGGFFGGLSAGVISDRIFSAKRG